MLTLATLKLKNKHLPSACRDVHGTFVVGSVATLEKIIIEGRVLMSKIVCVILTDTYK